MLSSDVVQERAGRGSGGVREHALPGSVLHPGVGTRADPEGEQVHQRRPGAPAGHPRAAPPGKGLMWTRGWCLNTQAGLHLGCPQGARPSVGGPGARRWADPHRAGEEPGQALGTPLPALPSRAEGQPALTLASSRSVCVSVSTGHTHPGGHCSRPAGADAPKKRDQGEATPADPSWCAVGAGPSVLPPENNPNPHDEPGLEHWPLAPTPAATGVQTPTALGPCGRAALHPERGPSPLPRGVNLTLPIDTPTPNSDTCKPPQRPWRGSG